MGNLTDRLIGRKGAAWITSNGNTLHWDTTIQKYPQLRAALTAWATRVCNKVAPGKFSYLVAKVAWSSERQINWRKTAREIVDDLIGTDMIAGGHDPTQLQGEIIAGIAVTVGRVDYAVMVGGIFPRDELSEALTLLEQVGEPTEPRLGPGTVGPIDAIFDGRDVDRAEVASCFSGSISVNYVAATHNEHEDAVDQIVRFIIPWGGYLLLAWGTPYGKKLQEKLAEAHAPHLNRWGEDLLNGLAGLARRMMNWRKPIVVIETHIAGCILMLRFKRVGSEDLITRMIDDLRRAVDEAARFIQYYEDKGMPFRAVTYDFSLHKRKWVLLSVHKANGVVLSSVAGTSLSALVNQASSVGIREP
ncbi:hypothetical protein [Nannocystis pusilla]|uniref:hypothetical protein n=1 Tax=Nannocystis pusilla TaxID=889268 RepID=UPI003DA55C0C